MRTLSFYVAALTLSCMFVAPIGAQDRTAAPDWNSLKATYDYDAKRPLEAKTEDVSDEQTYRLKLTFIGANGEKVPGVFLRPKAAGKYPVVLLLHGRGSNKEQMLQFFGTPLLKQGAAVLALDAPFHGERKQEGKNPTEGPVFITAVREGNRDWRRGLDWLAARSDVDSRRVGLFGYSMGSIMGAILGGVEPRIGSFVFCVGGDVTRPMAARGGPVGNAVRAVSPSYFVDHIAPRPILMLNGEKDDVINRDATMRLYDAAKEPKQILWFDTGHILNAEAVQKGVTWLGEKLHAK